MDSVAEQFAHVLLFACPKCARPLAAACVSTKRNLEVADEHWFTPHCFCGWTGDVIGFTAIRHWVEPWGVHAPAAKKNSAGTCDGQHLEN